MKTHRIFIAFVILCLYACKAPTDVVYFQDTANKEEVKVFSSYQPKLKPNDIISIYVSAADMDAARPFNMSQGLNLDSNSGGASNQNASEYLIDYDGNIEFPVLGKLKLSGLTRVQVQDMLKAKLKTYINNPIVAVRLKNFKITVLGEVRSPGSYVIQEDKASIIEAIGLAGDLSLQGKRDNITVIREEGDKKVYYKLDLTSKNIFDKPGYYLAQNDVIYVEPNRTKVKKSRVRDINTSIVYSTIGVLLSVLTFLVANR